MFRKNLRMRLLTLLILLLSLAPAVLRAQPGCTDPLATNYDPTATVNDGSCQYPNTTVNPQDQYPLSDSLRETSGLAAYAGWFWTHNDDTDTLLYA
ncbi:MAG: T9SS C-terminal target domain-containing protein, partial [Bacteroidetes bacterium]